MKYSAADMTRPHQRGQESVLKTKEEALNKEKRIKVYKMFLHAAEQGVTVAAFSLAVCHFKGEGTSQCDDSARKWFQVAAEQGHGQSAFNLGVMLEKAAAESKDINECVQMRKQATYWFKEAAKTGHPKARFNTGEWSGSLPLIKQAEREHISYRLVDANWRILEPDEDLFTKVLSPMEQLLKSQRGREASTYSLADTVSSCPEEVWRSRSGPSRHFRIEASLTRWPENCTGYTPRGTEPRNMFLHEIAAAKQNQASAHLFLHEEAQIDTPRTPTESGQASTRPVTESKLSKSLLGHQFPSPPARSAPSTPRGMRQGRHIKVNFQEPYT